MIEHELAELWVYLGDGYRLEWLIIGTIYFSTATYTLASKGFGARDYPLWFSVPTLLLSGAILLRVSSGFYWGETVTVYLGYFLLMAAALFLGTFFWVARTYAKHRETIDDALSDIAEEA